MNPLYKTNEESKRSEDCFYVVILVDITTWNSSCEDLLMDDMNNTNTTTIGSEVRCSGRISSLYSICGTHRATLIANLVIQCMS
jgi:hypothetical protein